jgi:hypothetical protein
MNKKILLMLSVFLLQTLLVFAQDTYSYGFNFDVKGYDVIPITHSCTTINPLNEECVAVGTVYNSIGNDNPNNGLHFIRFDKKGNLLTSVFINNINADERAVKILSINNDCRFVIVSLFREYTTGATDAIKLTIVDTNGLVLGESLIHSSSNSFTHLYPMDAVINDGYIYIVGSAVKNPPNSPANIGFGLNFFNDNRCFVYKAKFSNLSVNQLLLFGDPVSPSVFPSSGVYYTNSCYNIARTIKFTKDGRVFILGAANTLVSYTYLPTTDYSIPGAMIAELSNSNLPISVLNYKVYNDKFSNYVGTIAVDLYYDQHTDSMNLLVNDVKVEHNINAQSYGNQALLPWDAYRVYKVSKSNFNHSVTNRFQPFDNLYATNFIEQNNGNLKIVGWQFTSDASHTSPTTILRDCPFIQNVKIDNNVSNFMLPISLNTLVDGTLNPTSPYQLVGGNNLSSIWQLPRIGSLSGIYDNVVLTGTHLLNNPTFGLKCIFTDNMGNSCNNQEMTYNSQYTIPNVPTYEQISNFPSYNCIIDTTNSIHSTLNTLFNFSCNNDNLFKKAKNANLEIKYALLPNVLQRGEGFKLFAEPTFSASIPLNICIYNSIGMVVYKDIIDFGGNILVNPQIEVSGVYFVEILVDGIKVKEKLVVY